MVKPPEVYTKIETRKCTGAAYVATAFFTFLGAQKINLHSCQASIDADSNQPTN
jgi:hypothetical protein